MTFEIQLVDGTIFTCSSYLAPPDVRFWIFNNCDMKDGKHYPRIDVAADIILTIKTLPTKKKEAPK